MFKFADAATDPPPPAVLAQLLDREADALIMLGFYDRAERLAHQAAALRIRVGE